MGPPFLTSFSLSTNGTCSGVPLGAPNALTLARAADAADGDAGCASLGIEDGVGQIQIQTEYPGFPADVWVCNPSLVDGA